MWRIIGVNDFFDLLVRGFAEARDIEQKVRK